MPKFDLFSDDWFLMLERSNKKYNELNVSPLMESINLNISLVASEKSDNTTAHHDETHFHIHETNKTNVLDTIDDAQTILQLKLCAGYLSKAIDNTASTTLLFSLDTLKDLSQQQKMSSVLDAFINGHIQVQGDMSQLMALQMVQFSDEQRTLYQAILEQTRLS